ncbi:hypothetical protein [Caballeronia telluris]|uniref:hypothetical protein n=1 Tax=Caballeronia telluris TaxID=326475 RepID=UPI001F21DA17|nr:hypothetical protein [Caballeronia telluris]
MEDDLAVCGDLIEYALVIIKDLRQCDARLNTSTRSRKGQGLQLLLAVQLVDCFVGGSVRSVPDDKGLRVWRRLRL